MVHCVGCLHVTSRTYRITGVALNIEIQGFIDMAFLTSVEGLPRFTERICLRQNAERS
jgi:hypothetical protein